MGVIIFWSNRDNFELDASHSTRIIIMAILEAEVSKCMGHFLVWEQSNVALSLKYAQLFCLGL